MTLGIADSLASPAASGPQAPWLLASSSEDVDLHCANLGHWRLQYDQISAGAFRGSFTQLSLPSLEAFREVTSQQVRQYGRLGADSCGIAVPWMHNGDVNVNGSSVDRDEVIACFDAEVDMCTPRDFELRGVILSAAFLDELAAALDITLARDIRHQLRALAVPHGSIAPFRALLEMVQDCVDRTPLVFEAEAARQQLEDALLVEIIEMLPVARPCDEVPGAAARKRLVDRASELMLSRLDEPMSILAVCRQVGASRRKLNYCFQDVLGTSPVAYMRAVRLNKVRRALKTCTDCRAGVYDVAVQYGFWHFSQFSLDYKRHFAELPSETLRRARLAAGCTREIAGPDRPIQRKRLSARFGTSPSWGS